MYKTFSEIKRYQVKPDKLDEFEQLIERIAPEQAAREGCLGIRYMKRFYTIDGVPEGEPPRALTKIVKCVKYYSYWEFDNKENYGKANESFFAEYAKPAMKLTIMPFDIELGDSF